MLADQLGGRDRVPRGWWALMDGVGLAGRSSLVSRGVRALRGTFAEPLEPFDGYVLGPPARAMPFSR